MTLPRNSLWSQRLAHLTDAVCAYYGVESAALFRRPIPRELVRVRRVATYLAGLLLTDITRRSISTYFGGSPCLAANDREYLQRELATDTQLRNDLQQLQEQLTGTRP